MDNDENFEEKYLNFNTNERNERNERNNDNITYNNEQNQAKNNNLYFTLKNDEHDLENNFNKSKKSNKFLIPNPNKYNNYNNTDNNLNIGFDQDSNLDLESKYLEQRYVTQTINFSYKDKNIRKDKDYDKESHKDNDRDKDKDKDKDLDSIIENPLIYVKKPSNRFLIPDNSSGTSQEGAGVNNFNTYTKRDINTNRDNEVINTINNDMNNNSKNSGSKLISMKKYKSVEDQYREEYELKLKIREKEIEEQAKREFESAMSEVTQELENRLMEEKKQMENELIQKWNEKYESLEQDCKANLRDEKEKKLMANMYNKLKSTVEEKIYENEYPKIENKIKMEIEEKLINEIRQKKMLEIDVEKRRLENFTKKKLDEIENNLKSKCKESYDNDIRKEVENKEKELKTEYMKKFQTYKNKLENKLKSDYDAKKEELEHELKELKVNAYRQKCSENLKLANVSKLKQSLDQKDRMLNLNSEKLDKAIMLNQSKLKDLNQSSSGINPNNTNNLNGSLSLYKKPERKSSNSNKVNVKVNKPKVTNERNDRNERNYSIDNDDDIPNWNRNSKDNNFNQNFNLNNKTSITNPKITINPDKFVKDVTNENNSYEKEINRKNTVEQVLNSFNDNDKDYNENINDNNTKKYVNLMSVNQNLKRQVPTNLNSTNKIYNNNNANIANLDSSINNKTNNYNDKNNNLEISTQNLSFSGGMKNKDKDFTQDKSDNSSINVVNAGKIEEYQHDIPQKLTANNTNNSNNTNTTNNQKLKKQELCPSLQCNPNTPSNFYDIGKFLADHIENEENYKILFEKENKKLRNKLKKIFDVENKSDHCLLDYMIELWEKLEVSYMKRYKILNGWSDNKADELYSKLDKETESLTDYYRKTEGIYVSIKSREKLKQKLQQNSNKKKPTAEELELLKLITNDIEKKIKECKEKFNLNLVWKGVFYDWLINYEYWFYDTVRKNKSK